MKAKLVLATFVALTLGVGGLAWYQHRLKAAAERERVGVLQSRVQTLESELFESRASARATVPDASVVPVSALQTAASNPKSKPAPNPALLQNPETRALMRKQQEQQIASHADKLIDKNFARDWKLSEEQTIEAKALIREKIAAGKDMLNAMLFDGLDDAALAQRGRETKQRIGQSDATLRSLLGPKGFDALIQRRRSLENDQRVKRIRDELAAADRALTKEQYDALIATVGLERQAFPFRVDYNDPLKVDFERLREFFSEATLQMYVEDMLQFNARVAERAALFLSPEQLDHFKTSQQDQIEEAQLRVRTTTELFNKRREN
jgi:hypothetical protein